MTHQDDFLAAKANKTGKLTKDDIGDPFNFHHLTHIAFDPVKGFYVINEESGIKQDLDEFLKKTYKQSENKDIKKFIHAMFKKKLLTKGDISEPLTFQHTEHVGGKCYVCDGNCAHKDATSTKTKTDEKGPEMKQREELVIQPFRLCDM